MAAAAQAGRALREVCWMLHSCVWPYELHCAADNTLLQPPGDCYYGSNCANGLSHLLAHALLTLPCHFLLLYLCRPSGMPYTKVISRRTL